MSCTIDFTVKDRWDRLIDQSSYQVSDKMGGSKWESTWVDVGEWVDMIDSVSEWMSAESE